MSGQHHQFERQAKNLPPIQLVRFVSAPANPTYDLKKAVFRLGGLHPRLWVKLGIVYQPSADKLWPVLAAGANSKGCFAYMANVQRTYDSAGVGAAANEDGDFQWPLDTPIWGTEQAPIAMGTGTGGFNLIASTTPWGVAAGQNTQRIVAGHVVEFQTSVSEIEGGVYASGQLTTANDPTGTILAVASCFPADQMSHTEFNELASRFRWTGDPGPQTCRSGIANPV
jgi:hypothetical protein